MPQRDEDLRNRWIAKLTEFEAAQLVFCDESAANERTLDRKRGWALSGTACRTKITAKKTTRRSILPALTINGYLAYKVYHGSFNSERFNRFIQEQVLTRMNPYPAPRSVLIMDNASCHRSEELKDMCTKAGVILEFLPPYSPDFNPIEETFAALKGWMRRNQKLALAFEDDDYNGFIELAVESFMRGQNAKGYFRSCGIGLEEDHDGYDTD